MSNFILLPSDIIQEICIFLRDKEYVSNMRCCKHWFRLLNGKKRTMKDYFYKFELVKNTNNSF